MPHDLKPDERLKDLLRQRSLREREALAVFRPLPNQVPIFTSTASEFVVRGGNRSGKSVCGVALFSAALTRQQIIGPDGNPLPYQWPKWPLITWVIGWGEDHIGQTLFRLLFEPGIFNVVKVDGAWRVFNPATDGELAEFAVPAEPMIPKRFIKEMKFTDAGNKVFSRVELHNGNKIFAFTSTGEVKKGDPVDLIWVDEDIRWTSHVAEWQARLSDRKGRFIWTAWPKSSNMALVRMSKRAEEQRNREVKDVEETVLRFSDNPFMDDEEKRKRREGWDDEERRSRDYGEFVMDKVLMYPEFSESLHGVPSLELVDDPISKIYRDRRAFPLEWTRYLVMDPGHSTLCILFFVSAPEDICGGKCVILENELYWHRPKSRDQVCKQIMTVVGGKHYEAFIMDSRAGRQTPLTLGGTIKFHWSQAFEKRGIRSARTKSNFINGSDNVESRCNLVRTWLYSDESPPIFRVVAERCPKTVEEFGLYQKVMVKEEVQDKPIAVKNDAMNCIEYMAAHGAKHVPRTSSANQGSPAYQEAMRWRDDAAKKSQVGFFHLGPGGPQTPSAVGVY